MNLSQQNRSGGRDGMAEPEADAVEPGQSSDTECGSTNFPHRRHYAVRRKLGRAKTARLTGKSDQAPPADEEEIKSIPSAGKDRTESCPARPEEDFSDGGQSNDIDDESVIDDEEDEQTEDSSDDEDDVFDQDEDGPATICASQQQQGFFDEDDIIVPEPIGCVEHLVPGHHRPVVPVITIQPGTSIDMEHEVEETFYQVDGPMLTSSSSLLYPVDERDTISSAAFLTHACR